MTVPYQFANASTAIPLSQLDSNFNTAITIGNTAVQLGNTITTINNVTLPNVTISTGNANALTLTNATISSVTAPITVAQGGTGLTTLTANNVVIGNGTGNVTFVAPGTAGNVLTSNGTAWVSGAGATNVTLTNDTTTNANVYPLFANATSGTATTVFTGNAKLLYKPLTGELQASELVATNGIILNATTIATSYTVASGYNAQSVGPVTIAGGQSVTVTSGQRWVIL